MTCHSISTQNLVRPESDLGQTLIRLRLVVHYCTGTFSNSISSDSRVTYVRTILTIVCELSVRFSVRTIHVWSTVFPRSRPCCYRYRYRRLESRWCCESHRQPWMRNGKQPGFANSGGWGIASFVQIMFVVVWQHLYPTASKSEWSSSKPYRLLWTASAFDSTNTLFGGVDICFRENGNDLAVAVHTIVDAADRWWWHERGVYGFGIFRFYSSWNKPSGAIDWQQRKLRPEVSPRTILCDGEWWGRKSCDLICSSDFKNFYHIANSSPIR